MRLLIHLKHVRYGLGLVYSSGSKELPMFLAKIVSVCVVGILTALTARRVFNEVNAAKARAHVKRPEAPTAVTRLRQDPATGVYYPAE